MTVVSRPLLLILTEIGYVLSVIHLAGSPLVADVPAGIAAAVLVVGALVIAALLGPPRAYDRWASTVEGGVGGLLIVSGVATWSTTGTNWLPDLGIVGCGGVFVIEAVTRRRSTP